MRPVIAIASGVLWLASTSLAHADTYPRQPGVDAWHYIFRIELSDASPEITAAATVDLRVTRDDVREIALDLASPANGKGMTVTVGRVRACPVFGLKYVALVHNTIRGAAGVAILNAELLKAKGCL